MMTPKSILRVNIELLLAKNSAYVGYVTYIKGQNAQVISSLSILGHLMWTMNLIS